MKFPMRGKLFCVSLSGIQIHNVTELYVSGSSKIQTLLLIVENEKMGVLVN